MRRMKLKNFVGALVSALVAAGASAQAPADLPAFEVRLDPTRSEPVSGRLIVMVKPTATLSPTARVLGMSPSLTTPGLTMALPDVRLSPGQSVKVTGDQFAYLGAGPLA